MTKKSKRPPVTNRGVETPIGIGEKYQNYRINTKDFQYSYDVIIDWFEVTFKDITLGELFLLFNVEFYRDLIMYNTGLFGYNVTFVYKEKIKFMVRVPVNEYDQRHEEMTLGRVENSYDRNMGIHIVLSGYACREFEQIYGGWFWLFAKVVQYNCNVSRIDVAWDIFDDKLIRINRIKNAVRTGAIVTRAKTIMITDDHCAQTGIIIGQSVKVGKSDSEMMCMIYDKLQERKSADYIVKSDITYWVRIELRIRGDSAYNFVHLVNPDNFVHSSVSALSNFITFKIKPDVKQLITDIKHNHRNRWKNQPWWDSFLNTTDKLKLSSRAVQTSIQQKVEWFSYSQSKLLAKLLLADNDAIYGDMINRFIKTGLQKIKNMDLKQINEYRLERGGSIIDEQTFIEIKERLYERA